MLYTEIVKVYGRQIIDSRANPTVEAEVVLADGTVVGVDILVAQLANLLGNHGPGYHDLANTVVVDVGKTDEGR